MPASDRPLRAGELPFGLVVRVCASPARQESVFSLPCLDRISGCVRVPLLRLQTLSPHSRHSPSLASQSSNNAMRRSSCGSAIISGAREGGPHPVHRRTAEEADGRRQADGSARVLRRTTGTLLVRLRTGARGGAVARERRRRSKRVKNGVFGRIGCRQKKVRSAFGTGRKYFSSNVFKGLVKIRDKLSRRNRDKGGRICPGHPPFFEASK